LKSTSTVAQEDNIGFFTKPTKRNRKEMKAALKPHAEGTIFIPLLFLAALSLTFQECVLTWLFVLFLPFLILTSRLIGLTISTILLVRHKELWLSLAVTSFTLLIILNGIEIAALVNRKFTPPLDSYLWSAGSPLCCSLLDLLGWGILGAGLLKERK